MGDVHPRAARYSGPSSVGMSSLACQPKLAQESGERRLAEREGFEPPEPFPVQWFSRPPPSTTRPSLRIEHRAANAARRPKRRCYTESKSEFRPAGCEAPSRRPLISSGPALLVNAAQVEADGV